MATKQKKKIQFLRAMTIASGVYFIAVPFVVFNLGVSAIRTWFWVLVALILLSAFPFTVFLVRLINAMRENVGEEKEDPGFED